ncbi:MAG: hypothetical protein H6739_12380 [Alphaproteobacteria bacterium]|nr:hypothetical protein [Alphaproteobacteria bacterium]
MIALGGLAVLLAGEVSAGPAFEAQGDVRILGVRAEGAMLWQLGPWRMGPVVAARTHGSHFSDFSPFGWYSWLNRGGATAVLVLSAGSMVSLELNDHWRFSMGFTLYPSLLIFAESAYDGYEISDRVVEGLIWGVLGGGWGLLRTAEISAGFERTLWDERLAIWAGFRPSSAMELIGPVPVQEDDESGLNPGVGLRLRL